MKCDDPHSTRRSEPLALTTVVLDQQVVSAIAIIGGAVALLSLIVAIFAVASQRRMRHDYAVLQGSDGTESFIEAVARKTYEVEQLREEVAALTATLNGTRTDVAAALRHVAVVRYDAFGDLGGRLSFSAALLDDHSDGLVLTTIHARAESRSYLKAITGGQSDQFLSPEENEAIKNAMEGHA